MDKYLEDEGQTQEEFEAELERRVRDAVAAQFVLDEIAKKEEFGVDQAELSQHLVRRAQQSGQDPQEFANHMFEHNHIPDLVQEILRGKALATIVESAVVKDASGNVVELKNLRPDGTIGEPEAEAAEDATAEDDRRGHHRRGRPTRTDLPSYDDAPDSRLSGASCVQRPASLSEHLCTERSRIAAMRTSTDLRADEPGVLDALSLLSEVLDELVVRSARDTHFAVTDRVQGLVRAGHGQHRHQCS